jgi:pyruvate,orthophosphate dikinase
VAELIEPNPKESGLLDFIKLSKGFLKSFHVRCNADTPRDASLALSFGAEGVGLCRTEHMFFKAERINVFREMLLTDDPKERQKALDRLQVMQREDFYGIMKVMAGREVTIRLLDSPLHEFMPHNDDELKGFVAHITKTKKTKFSKADIVSRIEALHEFNPMLGHRGCRIAVSYPEIYAMQVKAIFEAAYKLRAEKVDVHPEIMVPIVMNASELKLIAYGKKIEGSSYCGIVDIEEALRKAKKAKEVEYRIGTMIELPAAALGAGEIARYGRFFSFGTNDRTQTTLGISRDDFTAFMPDYTLFDLINGNPFSTLDSRVKELITIATDRGRLTRPDLVCGLCGEHGANPENVRFCMDAGLNYETCCQ